ncbi:MAG: hypothetical protein ACM36C_03285 [Acidobacteriota bacterium]
MPTDSSRWSGDGAFTQLLIGALEQIDEVHALRVEDAPASRAETGYNLIANELFVEFTPMALRERRRWLGLVPYTAKRTISSMNLEDLASRLTSIPGVGAPDYADEGMIQYLRTERVVAPYQTRGVKVVELVRIYVMGVPPR